MHVCTLKVEASNHAEVTFSGSIILTYVMVVSFGMVGPSRKGLALQVTAAYISAFMHEWKFNGTNVTCTRNCDSSGALMCLHFGTCWLASILVSILVSILMALQYQIMPSSYIQNIKCHGVKVKVILCILLLKEKQASWALSEALVSVTLTFYNYCI